MRLMTTAILSALLCSGSVAQSPEKPALTAVYTYADVADLALAAKLVAHVKIKRAKKLPKALAQGVPAGVTRYIITADVVALVRGDEGIDPRVTYLVDVATDSRALGSLVSKGEVFIFANPGRPGEVQLVAPDAQLPWSAETADMVRKILRDSVKPSAPPPVTGIASAFFNPGALPGESETQMFLESGRPVSLTIVRTPDQSVNWFASLGDSVADGRLPPRRNTLLWYRLACFLPVSVPDAALSDQSAESAAAIRADYTVVMAGLGPCKRARKTMQRAGG
jgi:hypothetical protein